LEEEGREKREDNERKKGKFYQTFVCLQQKRILPSLCEAFFFPTREATILLSWKKLGLPIQIKGFTLLA